MISGIKKVIGIKEIRSNVLLWSAEVNSPYVYLLDAYPDTGNNGLIYDYFKLSSTYAGPCIRVRRDSDNTEQDIGFSGNYIDKAALMFFVGSASGFITKKYSQNGNANRSFFNTSAAYQPRIVNAGVLNEVGGFVYDERHAADVNLALGSQFVLNPVTSFQVFSDSGNTGSTVLAALSGTGGYLGLAQSGSTSKNDYRFGLPIYHNNGQEILTPTRDILYQAYNDGALHLASITGMEFSNFGAYTNNYDASSINAVQRTFATIVYAADQSSKRSEIEEIINQNYKIYP